MRIIKDVDRNLVEFELEWKRETEKALLLSDGENAYWIPKSQLEDDPEMLGSGLVRIIIPEWLAAEMEMV